MAVSQLPFSKSERHFFYPLSCSALLPIHRNYSEALLFLLSGTPMLNAPKDLIPQLQILGGLDDFGEWRDFTKSYCGLRYGIGRGGKEHPVYEGCTNAADLNRKLSATCMVRRRKDTVLPELGDLLRGVRPHIMVVRPAGSSPSCCLCLLR
jgi:hypothetical protein